ncbi:MAG: hypothetical protein LBU51_02335 [Bacteroidales bacterium]|jgi:hypothetical protein|nr:hypothetical protein [Bacteroidales bacterium]
MLIIHDSRLPQILIRNLQNYGDTVPFLTHNITDNIIAGHPDIFICPVGNQTVIAPNTPIEIIKILDERQISYLMGENSIGITKSHSTHYNVVTTNQLIIHQFKYTDPSIISCFQKQNNNVAFQQKCINIKQAYTRCSLLALKENHFITSDQGIANTLHKRGLDVFYMSPKEIILPGVSHGLLGGCLGVMETTVFMTGNLNYHSEGKQLKEYLSSLQYQIVELYEGPLMDGGGIFFFQ